MMNKIIYNGKEIPCIDSYDVAVVGGGFAGFSAAVTSARNGVRTILIERSGELGGTATLAGVSNFCTNGGSIKGHGKVVDMILEHLYRLRAIGEENGYNVRYNANINTVDYNFSPTVLSPIMLSIAVNSGVNLLFQTEVVDTICENGTVTHLIIHNESMLQAISCKVAIDGSGSGIVAMHSGGEALWENDNTKPIPPAFRIFLHKTHDAIPFELTPEACVEPLPYFVQFFPGSLAVLKINLIDEDVTTAFKRNLLEIETKKRCLATVEDFRKKYGSDYHYDGYSQILPVRETRRILGEYVLTAQDVRMGKEFDDSIATGMFIIDTVYHHENVPEYEIPYRSILVKNTENLLVVGRCFSADRYAMSSARIMITVSQMGEAAGAAAAISCKKNICLRNVEIKDIKSITEYI